ncbi:CDP-glycerol glycerophosphotransferase [Selenomonas sp. GACV-9]|uniref:CDP-glycerol glycerophosphotransferase family protein n=1 Tax=Selenomonas sp. GACV-9 TaxID=3158782 RepID=UPI0008EED3EE|nr:CDP-glycerol glycerophosphotransferase [Selenomonas ruminantium]
MLKQQWSEFYKDIDNKKVVVFGVGQLCKSFLNGYGSKLMIAKFVDNSPAKINHDILDIYPEFKRLQIQDTVIHSFEDAKCDAEVSRCILLIATKYDDEILKCIDVNMFDDVYSIAKMNRNLVCKKDKFSLLPVCNNKVVVFIGIQGGHGKAITRQLLQLNKDLDIVWVVEDVNLEYPSYVRVVKHRDLDLYYYEVMTAKVWIVDMTVEPDIPKKEDQIYLQVKHWSSITLKKFSCEDVKWSSLPGAIENQKKEAARTDYILSGSQFDEDSCRRGFLYEGKFIRVGSPRSDMLFDSNVRQETRRELGISPTENILLYAPTFRVAKGDASIYQYTDQGIDFEMLHETLIHKFRGEWTIFLRLHPAVADYASNIILPEYVRNVSMYDDSQELVACSDALISDYSSIIFEAAYVYKPIFLFAPDLDEYLKNERQLLLDYRTLPFSIAENNKELEDNIACFDEKLYRENVKNLFDTYEIHEDGHASERAAAFIVDLMGG